MQFTPDLMPSDVRLLGLRPANSSFAFRPGPVFTNMLLGDEINRAPPKTQAALLEAMEERQVTVDDGTHPLERPFLVLATQNPIEYEGTYPLPEAQLDRFLVRLRVGYPAADDEWAMLDARARRGTDAVALHAIIDGSGLRSLQAAVEAVHVGAAVGRYMVALATATRESSEVEVGASPRGSLALLRLSRARAALEGRDFVVPDDVKAVAVPALAHRLVLRPELWVRRVDAGDVVARVLDDVPARPRRSPRTMSASASPSSLAGSSSAWRVPWRASSWASRRSSRSARPSPSRPRRASRSRASRAYACGGSVAPDRLLEGDRAVVAYELCADGGAAWLELRPLLPPGLGAEPGREGAHCASGRPANNGASSCPSGRRAGAASERAARACGPAGRWVACGIPGPRRPRRRARVARHRAVAHARVAGADPSRASDPPIAHARRGLESPRSRPYVPGNQKRRQHWRATARRGEPFVAERHPERAPDVLIFVDAFAESSSPAARERR